jgi:hypothetical protein
MSGTNEVIELSQRHLCANILTHCNQCNAEDGESLECIIIFLGVNVIAAVM